VNSKSNFKIDRIGELLHQISGLTCLMLPLIIIVVVVIRATAPRGIPMWSIDICELLMWFVTYLSLGYVWRIGRHVRVEVILNLAPLKWRNRIELISTAIVFGMILIMLIGGFQVCLDAFASHKKTTNEFPEYYFSMAIPLGLLFLMFEVSVSLWKKLMPKTSARTGA